MTHIDIESAREIFERISLEDASAGGEGEFNTVNEKRIHRVLKRFAFELYGKDADTRSSFEGYEVRIGKSVADLLVGGRIFEIQTASLRPLAKKIDYYLKNTDYSVTVVIPVKSETLVSRIDRESGEIIRSRVSPKHESILSKLGELVYISDQLRNDRLFIQFIVMSVREERYSEKMRYRKKGAYDSELFPERLISIESFSAQTDYSSFIPRELIEKQSFGASDFEQITKLSTRQTYKTLMLLCNLGVLERKKEEGGRKYIYFCK